MPIQSFILQKCNVSARVTVYLIALLVLGSLTHLTIWFNTSPEFQGDELRYFDQASNIVEGKPIYPNGRIANTPLYPVIISVLMKAGVPIDRLGLSSVVLLLASSALLFFLLCRYCSPLWAFAVSGFFLLNPPVMMLGSRLMTEPLAMFMALAVCWQITDITWRHPPGLVRMIGIALTLMLLAMIKPIFGYALLIMVVLTFLLSRIVTSGARPAHLRASVIAVLALLFTLPYFAYTQPITGKYFSWVNSGVDHVYWMSIGGADAWGNWIPMSEASEHEFLVKNGYAQEISNVKNMSRNDADAYLSKLAKMRIKENPGHYVRNVIANTGRVLFNYPFSFRPQSLYTYGYILPNMMLYLSALLAVVLLPITFRFQPAGLSWFVLFGLAYLAGNVLVASAARQGLVLLGPILLWLAFQVRVLLDLGIINRSWNEKAKEL